MNQLPFSAVRDWVFKGALPFWAEYGVDREYGGFLEEVAQDGGLTGCSFKRVRVQCRQTYVFSQAAVLGWPGGEALSQMGYEYLVAHARVAGGGWAKVLTREGNVADASADLYDLAFVIFAMAWRYRASGDPEALAHARSALQFVQQNMTGPGGGFWAKLPASAPRLQNPHMHLTEACLAAFEASGDERFLDQAKQLVTLLRTRLFDGRTLGERFDQDWRRLDSAEGRTLEPGHHFEWTWILAQYQKQTGEQVSGEALALADFAERFGVDRQTGAVFDAVGDDGAPLKRSSRAWTNTERLKAWLAIFELTGRDPTAEVSSTLNLFFRRYFANAKPGAWIDQFDGEGRPMCEAVPASIVYHLLLAFQDLLRLEPALTAQRS